MKNKLLILAVLGAAALVSTGCTNVTKKLEAFDKLGIVEADLPGRVTYTEYRAREENGVITSEITHSNPLLVKPARVKRVRLAPQK